MRAWATCSGRSRSCRSRKPWVGGCSSSMRPCQCVLRHLPPIPPLLLPSALETGAHPLAHTHMHTCTQPHTPTPISAGVHGHHLVPLLPRHQARQLLPLQRQHVCGRHRVLPALADLEASAGPQGWGGGLGGRGRAVAHRRRCVSTRGVHVWGWLLPLGSSLEHHPAPAGWHRLGTSPLASLGWIGC